MHRRIRHRGDPGAGHDVVVRDETVLRLAGRLVPRGPEGTQNEIGAAQRRTRRGLLQQGSIQNIDLAPDFEKSLAGQLSQNCIERTIEQAHVERAQQIAKEKYATDAWLRRR